MRKIEKETVPKGEVSFLYLFMVLLISDSRSGY